MMKWGERIKMKNQRCVTEKIIVVTNLDICQENRNNNLQNPGMHCHSSSQLESLDS